MPGRVWGFYDWGEKLRSVHEGTKTLYAVGKLENLKSVLKAGALGNPATREEAL